jgi:hypothetical protein
VRSETDTRDDKEQKMASFILLQGSWIEWCYLVFLSRETSPFSVSALITPTITEVFSFLSLTVCLRNFFLVLQICGLNQNKLLILYECQINVTTYVLFGLINTFLKIFLLTWEWCVTSSWRLKAILWNLDNITFYRNLV